MNKFLILGLLLGFISCNNSDNDNTLEDVNVYLETYNDEFQKLVTETSEAEWILNTHIVKGDTIASRRAERANERFAKFTGSTQNIETARKFLKEKEKLSPVQIRQLETILSMAAANPEVAMDIVKEKIIAETQQVEKLFGFDYKLDGESLTTNEIDEKLRTLNDITERLKVWKASKEVGVELKGGLAHLRDLRNKSVQALDYKDYFSYQVSDYGMTAVEMKDLCNQFVKDAWPLYRELHTWARYELAKRYEQAVPDMLPAHWLPNRWGQEWRSLVKVKGLDLDSKIKAKGAEWIVEEGERFYMSLGFNRLPKTFYEKSSLYPLPEGATYKKNNHASAWHMDYKNDVRSLMSIVPNADWWSTTLHELGHIYYYQTYTNPDVPIILREGANRAFHEAMGTMVGLAAMQKPFLVEVGLIDANMESNEEQEIQALLQEALDYIVVLPWGAGVMTEFEYELYANNLPANEFNKKWWELKEKYQGISAPEERGEEYCDAASKTHINNDPAQYYDYALANILLFQFHDHIAKNILNQDPRNTNYYGNKQVGDFIKKLMYPGANTNWHLLLKENVGSEMTAKAMIDYFAPLMEYLKNINKGRIYTLRETF